MYLPFVKTLIDNGWISPAGGRFIESATSVAVAAGIMYLADQYSNGGTADYKTAGTIAIAAVMQWWAKSLRDADKEAALENNAG
jgi:hypothetical protein